jgi:hypothetical protein
MTQKRARNLSPKDVADIVGTLDGWTGKLSWESLIDAVERRKHARYTRQALYRHEQVRLAFTSRKKALSGQQSEDDPGEQSPELRAALERKARLEAENARLRAENDSLLEQFARWAYNAHTRGLDKAFLNRPLPPVNRDQTVRTHR